MRTTKIALRRVGYLAAPPTIRRKIDGCRAGAAASIRQADRRLQRGGRGSASHALRGHRDGRAPARSARACPCAGTRKNRPEHCSRKRDRHIADRRRAGAPGRAARSTAVPTTPSSGVGHVGERHRDRDREHARVGDEAGCGDSFTCRGLAARRSMRQRFPEWAATATIRTASVRRVARGEA